MGTCYGNVPDVKYLWLADHYRYRRNITSIFRYSRKINLRYYMCLPVMKRLTDWHVFSLWTIFCYVSSSFDLESGTILLTHLFFSIMFTNLIMSIFVTVCVCQCMSTFVCILCMRLCTYFVCVSVYILCVLVCIFCVCSYVW